MTRQIEIDQHFIKEKLDNGLIDNYDLHSFSVSTYRCVNKGLTNQKIQQNYFQVENDRYPFTSLRGSVVNNVIVLAVSTILETRV